MSLGTDFGVDRNAHVSFREDFEVERNAYVSIRKDFKGEKPISVHEYAGKTHGNERQDAQSDTERPSAGPTSGHTGPVELALADPLQRAAVAGAWTVVERLAGKLEARRKERTGAAGLADVVTLNSACKREPP